jgi:hypothetical protein
VESPGELGWFRSEVIRSVIRPQSFSRSLAREHFGLAGVLVALAAGMGLSITVDTLVVAAKGLSPLPSLSRLLIESFLLGVRVDVSVAAVAFALYLAASVTRRVELTLDQSFNAIAFALSPIIVAPVAAVIATLDPGLLGVAGVVMGLILVRVLAGLTLNLHALLPLPVAALALALVLAGCAIVLADQVSRVRMTAYAIAPQLAAPLAAAPTQGKRYEIEGMSLTVPEEWVYSVRGSPGEVAHFETPTATLNVMRGRVEAFATMDSFADQMATDERLGFAARRNQREVVSISGLVTVADRADGAYEGRHIALCQFAIVQRATGVALQFRFFDPPDVAAAFAQAAAIAATWQLSGGSALQPP